MIRKFISSIFSISHWFFILTAVVLVGVYFNRLPAGENFLKPLVDGVLGGVVTSIFLLIFSKLWKSDIVPWFENITYRDTKIEGVWQGVLVPHIGIEEIDRFRMQAALKVFGSLMKKRKESKAENDETPGKGVPVDAFVEKDGEMTRPALAELVLSSDKIDAEEERNKSKSTEKKKHVIPITIGVNPIKVRLELCRTGHEITGRLIEIGGASQVHTYKVCGSFKNLIICGVYENENRQNIDRGSFSLMLRKNGAIFEGFFSSYADTEHKIHPFRCILQRAPAGVANT